MIGEFTTLAIAKMYCAVRVKTSTTIVFAKQWLNIATKKQADESIAGYEDFSLQLRVILSSVHNYELSVTVASQSPCSGS